MRGLVAVLVLLLAGCATPAGKLTNEDFVWADYSINRPANVVYVGLQEHARACGNLVGQDPEWFPALDGKSAKIDLYAPGVLWAQKIRTSGRILVASDGSKTSLRIGMSNITDHQLFSPSGWWRPVAQKMISDIETGAPPSCA